MDSSYNAIGGEKYLTSSTIGRIVDLKSILRAAKDQGWTVVPTSKGHLKMTPADRTKPLVIASGTPGDFRALRNLLATCRRSGLIWPWPPKNQ